MKKLIYLAFCLLCLMACGEKKPAPEPGNQTDPGKEQPQPVDVPYTFSIDPTQVEVPGEGGRFTVTVTCPGGKYHMQATADWMTEISVENQRHTFEAAANDSGEQRSGVLVFCDDVGTCLPCMVTQAAR
jgi:hypothetical protein